MGIITKKVEVKPSGKMIQYYKNLGYDAKYHQPLIVKIDDLQKGSRAIIEVLCDMCHDNSMLVAYQDYNRVVEKTGNYVCKECSQKKRQETNLKKYGVKSPVQLEQVRNKMQKTNLERYGVKSYSQTQECIEKMKKTMELRYGVKHALQSKDFQNAYKSTCIENYGENYCKLFAEKAFNSYYQNTGYLNPMQSPDVRNKIVQTCYKNGSISTSKQQCYIFNLYNKNGGACLNYPISYYASDICFPEEKLCIEYDGGGHDLRVTLGCLTQEEFDQKEIIRNNTIKREGYKIIRLKSSKDLLPSDQILLQMLSQAKQYFSDYPQHSWITYDIDKSLLFNAEHKTGIL